MRVNGNPFAGFLGQQKQALLQPYVEVAMSSMIEIRPDNLSTVRDLNESVMHFVPINLVVYREVWMLALFGEQEAARLQLERAIWAYPEGFPAMLEQLQAFAQKDPAHFAALLEFAPGKYEEYQRAVHTK